MRVFLTGGTGFVGSEVLRQLTGSGHTVRALVRPGSEGKLAVRERVEIHRGDATDPSTLQGALNGCDAVIHLVGIIREFPSRGVTFHRLHFEATRNMVAVAEIEGVRRYLQMSANGTRKDAPTAYHRTKWMAEETVRTSALQWTIFRPSLIFGPDDEFVSMLAGLLRKLPAIPVIGNGQYRMAPVAVGDIAAGFVHALDNAAAIGQTYHCCGPAAYTYNEVLDLIGKAIGRKRIPKLHQPAFLLRPAIALLDGFPWFPVTREQLTMLLEGNVCDPRPWAETLGIEPLPFPEGLRHLREKR